MSASHVFKMPDGTFSPWLLHREVGVYVIQEFREKLDPKIGYPSGDDAKEIVQFVIDKSTNKFRMYGSAEEILENVRIFSTFPESHQFFTAVEGPYMNSPIIFDSLRTDGKFICKSDVFVILQNIALEANKKNPEELTSLISIHLKSQEEKVKGRTEFVRFDERLLAELRSDFTLGLEKYDAIYDENLNAHDTPTIDEWLAQVKSLSPDAWTASRTYPRTLMILRRLHDYLPPADRWDTLKTYYDVTRKLTKAFQFVIDKHPELFLPHRISSPSRHPMTVRVFEDGGQVFMLREEISWALIQNDSILADEPLDSEDDARVMHTIAIDDVIGCYDITDIEFIRYPILRAKHRAVPVKVSTKDGPQFYVLAIDVLFEFLREVIFTHRIFQTPHNMNVVLESLSLLFLVDCTRPYFFSNQGLISVEQVWLEVVKSTGTYSPIYVRNAKKDGFTVQNLKNELAHLNLTEAFPEIQNHAEIVYSEVDKRKKKQVLRTCDLFDAIEHCQLICIFNRLPHLKKFLHNQKSCRRVIGMECATCPPFYRDDRPKTATESKNPSLNTVGADSDAKKISDSQDLKKTTPESKKSDQKPSAESEKQTTTLEKAPKTPEIKKPVQNTPKPAPEPVKPSESPKPASGSKTPPESQKSSESPNQKTSANCEKCFRACEMLNETKKDLKTSENQLKNLEKKLAGKEREMEELKKNQKGKMDKKEKELQTRVEEIQGLKKRNDEKTEENRSLKDQIAKQESSMIRVEEEKLRQKEQFKSTQKHLEERVSQLMQELREGNEKRRELQNQMASDKAQFKAEIREKYRKLEELQHQTTSDEITLKSMILDKNLEIEELQNLKSSEEQQFVSKIQEKDREIEELKERELRMTAENEVNQRMIQQLMDKLASSGVSSGVGKNSEVSKTSSRIQKCEICWNETSDREAVRCQKCRRPFHQKCSSLWLKKYKNCPSCEEEFIESTRNQPPF